MDAAKISALLKAVDSSGYEVKSISEQPGYPAAGGPGAPAGTGTAQVTLVLAAKSDVAAATAAAPVPKTV